MRLLHINSSNTFGFPPVVFLSLGTEEISQRNLQTLVLTLIES